MNTDETRIKEFPFPCSFRVYPWLFLLRFHSSVANLGEQKADHRYQENKLGLGNDPA
jgi:hypothetical protein